MATQLPPPPAGYGNPEVTPEGQSYFKTNQLPPPPAGYGEPEVTPEGRALFKTTVEASPLQKFTSTLGQGNLAAIGSAALDVPKVLAGDMGASQRIGQFVSGMAQGLWNEPSRIVGELQAAKNAKTSDETWQHLQRAVPLIGPQGEKILHQIDQGAYAEASANMVDLVGQFLGPELAKEYGPSILSAGMRAGSRAVSETGAVASGVGEAGKTLLTKTAEKYLPGSTTALAEIQKARAAAAIARNAEVQRLAGRTPLWATPPPDIQPVPPKAPNLPVQGPIEQPVLPTGRVPGGIANQTAPVPPVSVQAATPDPGILLRDQLATSLTKGNVRSFERLQAVDPRGAETIDRIAQQELARQAAQAPAPPVETLPVVQQAPPSPQATPPPPVTPALAEAAPALQEAPQLSPAAAAEAPQTAEEAAKAKARITRAARAGQWADYFEQTGTTADDVRGMDNREKWRFAAQKAGLEIPATKDATMALRNAIADELARRKAAMPAPAVIPFPQSPAPQPSWFNPSSLQRLIDLQESGKIATPR